jgi:hypothetical protein
MSTDANIRFKNTRMSYLVNEPNEGHYAAQMSIIYSL